jgi:hypothetical protein
MLNFPVNIIRMIKSKRIKWAGYVSRMVEIRNSTKFWLENLKGTSHSNDTDVFCSLFNDDYIASNESVISK